MTIFKCTESSFFDIYCQRKISRSSCFTRQPGTPDINATTAKGTDDLPHSYDNLKPAGLTRNTDYYSPTKPKK